MRHVVLDTNVIVSAGLKEDSIPFRIIEWVLEERVRAITSPYVLHEYRRVLGRAKFTRFDFPPSWIEELIEWSVQLPEPKPWPDHLPDPKDKPFLALAHAANAWLITGNTKHFPESACNGVKVLTPNEYLAWLLHEN